jgi:hypothetical protein
MSRRKKPDEAPENDATANGVAVADPPAEVPAPEQQQGAPDVPPVVEPAKPPPNRPAASFAAQSDVATRIEVAVWGKQVKSGDGEITQYSLTLSRSWLKGGHWQGNANFRVHDVPVLLFLLQQAYHWCVAQRTTVKIGDEPVPF